LQKETNKLHLLDDIFRIPNLFTLLNIIAGFFSILFVIDQNYNIAGILIILGMLFDFLDGFTAKILNQPSEFGMQLDSFADVLTFGAAPVVLVYGSMYHLNQGLFYKISLLIYFIAIVYRLSKYNIIGTNKDGTFRGLPSTFSGGFISIIAIWFPIFYSYNYSIVVFLFLALLSISNIPYKKIKFTNIYDALILLLLIIAFIFFDKYVLLFTFIIYFLSGFYNILIEKYKKRKS
jgi:CDP-diacylglycerol---serine O-phosphatidyltransferase